MLYIKQPYPDNYTDRRHFLHDLRKNSHVRYYTYPQLIRQSLSITTQLSSLTLFILVFIYLHIGVMSASTSILIAHILNTLGYMMWVQQGIRRHADAMFRQKGKQTAKSAIIFLLTLLMASPLLRTLTEDISTDTVWRMAVICFITHLIFFDYSCRMTGTLALNAVIFAAVILGSRLPTSSHVFGFLMIAVNWFALFPLFRRYLKQSKHHLVEALLGIALFMAVTILAHPLSILLMVVYVAVTLLITFVAPAWFIHLQRYKHTIHGPWDEAIPQNELATN